VIPPERRRPGRSGRSWGLGAAVGFLLSAQADRIGRRRLLLIRADRGGVWGIAAGVGVALVIVGEGLMRLVRSRRPD
jgi:hypothetical protein